MNNPANSPDKVRIDKWLWAARFFKTRSLAKQAIEGGKVHVNGQRAKASKEINLDAVLTITKGWDTFEVTVKDLSDVRRGAPQAALLYEETPDSIQARERNATQRKLAQAIHPSSEGRPTKKQRRQIHRFKTHQSTEQ